MSFQALAWAATQKTGSLAAKAVLLALANYADEEGCAYPSTAAIAAFGEMDHKTATAALGRLSEAGLIADTGERAGRTKQVKIYKLSLNTPPIQEAFQNRKPPVSSAKDPQKRGTDTIRDTISQKATPSSSARNTTVPADFLPVMKPDSATAKTVAGWPPGELEEEVEHFIDFHTSKGTLSKCWQASWRTWVKLGKRFNGKRPANDRSEPGNAMFRVGLAEFGSG